METFLSQPFGPTRYVSFLCFSCSSFFVFPSLLVFAFYFSLYLFAFLFPNQVLEEYKKRYPEEELPDFLRLNLVCWINQINFDGHQFRDHVKDNAIRTYLRAPKKAALFESKRFCKLLSLNYRNYPIKVKKKKHQTVNIKLGLYEKEGDNKYNAFDKDIAVVHFFFQVITVAICLYLICWCWSCSSFWSGTKCVPVQASTEHDLDWLHIPGLDSIAVSLSLDDLVEFGK